MILFCVQWLNVRGSCSLSWYRWNCRSWLFIVLFIKCCRRKGMDLSMYCIILYFYCILHFLHFRQRHNTYRQHNALRRCLPSYRRVRKISEVFISTDMSTTNVQWNSNILTSVYSSCSRSQVGYTDKVLKWYVVFEPIKFSIDSGNIQIQYSYFYSSAIPKYLYLVLINGRKIVKK